MPETLADNVWFGTEFEGPRSGRCYELAGTAMMRGLMVHRSVLLVHGTIFNERFSMNGRSGHAWVEFEDGAVWEPILGEVYGPLEWEEWATPRQDEGAYNRDDVLHLLVSSGHYGPWSTAEIQRMRDLRDNVGGNR